MPITLENLLHWFTYHRPNEAQTKDYEAIRNAGLSFARIIISCTPTSADQTDAIRKVREAVMTANAAIACDGK